MGDDDLFSSDFSDAQLKARLGHMARVPCQVFSQLPNNCSYLPLRRSEDYIYSRLQTKLRAFVQSPLCLLTLVAFGVLCISR